MAPRPRRRSSPTAPPRGAHNFAVRTRLAKATGKDGGRYAYDSIQALPSPAKDTVILEATDSRQAVCLLAPGQMAGSKLVPSGVLPTRQLPQDAVINLVDGQWQSSEGRIAEVGVDEPVACAAWCGPAARR